MRINLFSRYCRQKYGQPVGKIALSLGRPCPNRRLGGCVYCGPASFTPYYLDGDGSLAGQVARGWRHLKSRKFRRYFAYFQQETPTAGPLAEVMAAFREASAAPECVGLIVSTRPDCLSDELLSELAALAAEGEGRELLIELGLQSAHDATLKLLNRHHSVADFSGTARRVKAAGLALGVHLILGLPGEGFGDMLATVRRVSALGVDAIKFHHLQVIRGTALERIYHQYPFPVYTPQEYLAILARLLAHVPPEVVIHRLWSSSDAKSLVQPRWGGLTAQQLKAMLQEIMEQEDLWQGKLCLPPLPA
jgi:radical SAM protein (TIGR01212 family)